MKNILIKNILIKNILITGGCGFIAKNLILKLQLDNSNIICVDNFITSNKQDFLNFIIKHNLSTKITLVELDITNPLFLQLEPTLGCFHEIYHLASLASPIFYKQFPLETMDVGYIGTKHVLEIAKKHKSKVLFSSTSEVYGDVLQHPQNENYYGNVNSFGIRSSYDESKRIAEALCYTYINSFGLDIKIARVFNTYGPEMLLSDGRIITECIKHLINNTTLTIFGDGQQTRSLCYVSDTTDMLINLMNSNSNIPVNIGNNEEFTINQITQIILDIYSKLHPKTILKSTYKDLTQNDPLQRKPCLKLNHQLLGKYNYTSFETGITQTIKHFKL